MTKSTAVQDIMFYYCLLAKVLEVSLFQCSVGFYQHWAANPSPHIQTKALEQSCQDAIPSSIARSCEISVPYRRVDGLVTCGLTACTPESAPGPMLGNVYGRTLLCVFTDTKSNPLTTFTTPTFKERSQRFNGSDLTSSHLVWIELNWTKKRWTR